MQHRRRQSAQPKSISRPSFLRRHAAIIAVSTLLGVSVVCDHSVRTPGQGSDQARYHDKTFRVVRVVDGDTLDIAVADGKAPATRIRLWGVDAPELGHDGDAAMYFGREAASFATETLLHHDVHIVLARDQTRGKYGRLLAYVYLERGGTMFNELLLERGLSYADLRFPHRYTKQFNAAEKRARKAGVGLWAEVTVEKMPEWRRRFESG